jgi:YedE family putative selenium metabolism protein
VRDRLTLFFASRWGIVLARAVIGLIAVVLQRMGNPPNMGVCVACFERDVAGALGLHRAGVVQYLRPEIPAFVLGSLLAALLFREFRARGGSAPLVRFLLGGFAMIGALAFLGCPWRALLRLGAGDGNALVGLAGLTAGIAIGVAFLRRGYTLGRSRTQAAPAGWILPGLMAGLLVLAFVKPSFLLASAKGPGAMAAPIAISLAGGLLIGAVAQRTRFCTMGSVRDVLLARDVHLISGVAALVAVVFVANLILGRVSFGFASQPVGHSDHPWNFLGMVLAGLAFAMAGGCPGRQLFLAGEGDSDAGVFVLGMIVGAAFAHNFALAAVPDRVVDGSLVVGGPGPNGQVAVVLGLVVCGGLGFLLRERWEETR